MIWFCLLNYRSLQSYSIELDPQNHFDRSQEIGDELNQSSDLVICCKEDSYNEEHLLQP